MTCGGFHARFHVSGAGGRVEAGRERTVGRSLGETAMRRISRRIPRKRGGRRGVGRDERGLGDRPWARRRCGGFHVRFHARAERRGAGRIDRRCLSSGLWKCRPRVSAPSKIARGTRSPRSRMERVGWRAGPLLATAARPAAGALWRGREGCWIWPRTRVRGSKGGAGRARKAADGRCGC